MFVINNTKYYKKILHDSDALKECVADDEYKEKIFFYPNIVGSTAYAVAPVLFDYVYWILKEARSNKINRLYFLSRDGYILYQIALLIVERESLNIECRYLYTSRFASRIPIYHLLGKKCLDFICEKKMHNTIRSVIQNITLNNSEQIYIQNLLGVASDSLDKELNSDDLRKIKSLFLCNKPCMDFIFAKSKENYEIAIKYFKQEGLFDSISIAFVDVGWRGTMQIALNKLLKTNFCGFYFGLYTNEFLQRENNKYYTYLFEPQDDSNFVKYFFNNSLFECFCSAPTGMTTGYKEISGKIVPTFTSSRNINSKKWIIDEQIKIILSYSEKYLDKMKIYEIDKDMTKKILKRLMYAPCKSEAKLYGQYLFSDETNESTLVRMAPPLSVRYLLNRFLLKIWKSNNNKKDREQTYFSTYWLYGSIKRSHIPEPINTCLRFYYFYRLHSNPLKKLVHKH